MNPRRPTPSGPKPDPFDLARAPPPNNINKWRAYRDYALTLQFLLLQLEASPFRTGEEVRYYPDILSWNLY